MKKSHIRNNIAVLDIGKTHAKVILFDSHKLKELEVFQTENIILTDSLLTPNPTPIDIDVNLDIELP